LKYLEERGYTLLERNHRTRHGEINLAMRHAETLVFVEVKLRLGMEFRDAHQVRGEPSLGARAWGGRAGGHGLLGRSGAAQRYRELRPELSPGRQAKFESYAISKIRWAILNQLRSQAWIPRRIRSRAREIEKAGSS
jgi:hypothetical protein